MKIKLMISLAIITNSFVLFGQYNFYDGSIGKSPIKLTLLSYSDNYIDGVYAYDKYNTPIGINGNLVGDTMIFYENYNWNKYKAVFNFPNWNVDSEKLVGVWINLDTKEKIKVVLNRSFKFEHFDDTQFDTLELMQCRSTKNDFFMLLVEKNKSDMSKVFGVRVYDKISKKLKQQIILEDKIDTRLFDYVVVNDFNYDGVEDFAIKLYDNNGRNPWGFCFMKKKNTYVEEKYQFNE